MALEKIKNCASILSLFENDTPSALSCKASVEAAAKEGTEKGEMEKVNWKQFLNWEKFPRVTSEFTDVHVEDIRIVLKEHPEITEMTFLEIKKTLRGIRGSGFFETVLREILNREIPEWDEIKNVPYTERTPKYRNMSRVLLADNSPKVVLKWIGESVEHLRSLQGTPREPEPYVFREIK
ncbi:MAG TPA: hypothetical protein DCG28_00510 [Lachnospiraceae bacterium]|nr:hypothetical protein [Lachnospiraceae bacterium]